MIIHGLTYNVHPKHNIDNFLLVLIFLSHMIDDLFQSGGCYGKILET
jgi:hypothetical protein